MKKSELAERIERLERELADLRRTQGLKGASAPYLPEPGVLKPWHGPYVDHIYRPYPHHYWDPANPLRVTCVQSTTGHTAPGVPYSVEVRG